MKAIIMFGGFQESEVRQSGFEKGFFSTVRPFASGEITVYHPRTWKTNIKNLLRQLYENGISKVAIITYSHGQAAAMDLARQADKYGVSIELLMCCDPIYRPAWLPRWTLAQAVSFRSIIGSPTIKVPDTVRRVHYVIQDITLPKGHRMVAEDKALTNIYAPIKIPLPHVRIDESPTWWSLVKMHLEHFVAT
jgi:hypothetical protein